MQNLNKYHIVIFLILTFSGNCVGNIGVDSKVDILDFYPGNLPKRIILIMSNNSSNKISIYQPNECFYFFWSALITYDDNAPQEYLIRSDIPWKEPSIRILQKGEEIIDTVTLVPNCFYKINCKHGCTPFSKSAKVVFKYEFKGMKTVKANTRGVFIPDSTATIAAKPTVGTWFTNMVTFPAIDLNKLQDYFTEDQFGIPLITIKDTCGQ